MSRLTNKDDRGRYYTVEEKILIANEPVNPTTTWIVHNENRRYGSPIEKLGKLEDLEEEIGCPLEAVAKAITYGIAYELKNGLIESEPHISLTECGYGYILCSGSSTRKVIENGEFQTKDYKKTWWLKEDRSE